MPALTRGPLPARVYWVRRILVFGTALLLVFGIARLLGNGSDASGGGDDQAAQVAADTSASSSLSVSDSISPSESARKQSKKKTKEPDPTPTLAVPTGACSGSDVAVTPMVKNAVAGRDVLVVLQLRTMVSEACTWRVGPDTLTMSLTSGSDDVWSTRDCPKAIPVRDVVVRKAVTTDVEVTWPEAKRSDDTCSRFAGWAMPGWYHVTAAALGGEPSDLQFELVRPTPATITRTVQPSGSASGRPVTTPSGKPSGKPSNSPSGAVEPN